MRRVLISAAVVLLIGASVVIVTGASNGPGNPTYGIEFDNAFGLVGGAPLKVAGVPAGSIKSIDLCLKDRKAHCQNPLHALVTVQVTSKGFGSFRSDASCQSRPQSLIGEYFVDCQPGQYGKVLASGSTISASHTFSTIPADLLGDIMRLPQRERLTLIVNELGAAVAGRSEDLQTALQRAVPALNETDNLLNLLANDSSTLQQLTASSDTVVTALANNSKQVQNFIVQARNAAADTATQRGNLRATLHDLPPFLEQLGPEMAKLGAAADANTPVVENLNAAAGQLHTLLTNIAPCSSPHNDSQCGFADASKPALQSLGQAAVTGKQAVKAATPTVALLNKFARPTPELAQNLSIVLHDLDDPSRAVEPDARSPGGTGFTGLEALLWYAFNQTLAINTFGPFGHMLSVDAFVSPMCSPYATPGTIAANLKTYGSAYRQCYSWLGPNQPGVNESDPSNPGGCVPDPGGAPPGEPGPATTAKACPPQPLTALPPITLPGGGSGGGLPVGLPGGLGGGLPLPLKRSNSSNSPPSPATPSPSSVANAVSKVAQGLAGRSSAPSASSAAGAAAAAAGSSTSATSTSTTSTSTTSTSTTSTTSTTQTAPATPGPSPSQAQQLLNYLLSP